MTPIANLSQIEKKTHMFFLVVITNVTVQLSRLRFSTFTLLLRCCVCRHPLLFLSAAFIRVRCSNTHTMSFRFIKIPSTQTCSSRSAADSGLKRIHVPEFRLCLVEQCIVKCQAKLSRRNIFFHSLAQNPTRAETRNCTRNNRNVFSCISP